MVDRDTLINRFLESAGWATAERQPLSSDASFRHYVRLGNSGRTAMLMDAPPPMENVRSFVSIAKHLRHLGYSAPEILAEDIEHGLLVIEDLGDDTFTRLLINGADEKELYLLAMDVLIDLHQKPSDDVIPDDLPLYDERRLLDEAALLVDWYLPAIENDPTPNRTRKDYMFSWLEVFHRLHTQARTLVLRDYHVDNLIRLSNRNGVASCGLLDFQDALAGPTAYDVMSLLEDARRDIAEDLKKSMLERYFQAFPGLDRPSFETAFAILGAQRHAKVIGIFTRLCWRDGKEIYLQHIPRVWDLLEHSLSDPVLAPVKDWFARHMPSEKRIIPPCPPNRS